MHLRLPALLVLLVSLGLACKGAPADGAAGGSSADGKAALSVVTLTDSLTPLQELFNQGRGKGRLLAFLSPTCQACLDGAQAVRQSVAIPTNAQQWLVALVWVPMRPADDEQALQAALARFAHPRLRQFVDAERKAGWAFARAAFPGFNAPAWDVYLLYDGDSVWRGPSPPPPAARLAQFRGPGGTPTVAEDLDANQRPIPLGPGSQLPQLLRERVQRIDRSR